MKIQTDIMSIELAEVNRMDDMLVTDIKNTYYEYVNKVSDGCMMIAQNLRLQQYEQAFNDIVNLAEGLQWLISVEEVLKQNNFQINSRISEANEFMNEVNDALEQQDYVLLADLFEYELNPLFNSSSEWVFMEG